MKDRGEGQVIGEKVADECLDGLKLRGLRTLGSQLGQCRGLQTLDERGKSRKLDVGARGGMDGWLDGWMVG